MPDIRWRRLRQSRNQRSVSGAEMFVVAFGAWENKLTPGSNKSGI
jgi:hypothetical protein